MDRRGVLAGPLQRVMFSQIFSGDRNGKPVVNTKNSIEIQFHEAARKAGTICDHCILVFSNLYSGLWGCFYLLHIKSRKEVNPWKITQT